MVGAASAQIYRLREQKQKAQMENTNHTAVTEYDENLVRRLIEKMTVYEDRFTNTHCIFTAGPFPSRIQCLCQPDGHAPAQIFFDQTLPGSVGQLPQISFEPVILYRELTGFPL